MKSHDLSQLAPDAFQRLACALLRQVHGASAVTAFDLGHGVNDGGWDARVDGMIDGVEGPWRVEVKHHRAVTEVRKSARKLVGRFPDESLMLITSARLSEEQRERLRDIDVVRWDARRWVVQDGGWVDQGLIDHPWLVDVFFGGDSRAPLLDLLGASDDAVADAKLTDPRVWCEGPRFRSEDDAVAALVDALRANKIALLAPEPRSEPLAVVVGAVRLLREEQLITGALWLAEPAWLREFGLAGLRRKLGAGAERVLIVTDDADVHERIAREPPGWLRAVLVCRDGRAEDLALRLGSTEAPAPVVALRTPSGREEFDWATVRFGDQIGRMVIEFGGVVPLRALRGDVRGVLSWLSVAPPWVGPAEWTEAIETAAWVALLDLGSSVAGEVLLPPKVTAVMVATIAGLDEVEARRRLHDATQLGLLRNDREPDSFPVVSPRQSPASTWAVLRWNTGAAAFWSWIQTPRARAWCEDAIRSGRLDEETLDRVPRRIAERLPELAEEVRELLARPFEAMDDVKKLACFRQGGLAPVVAVAEWAVEWTARALKRGENLDGELAERLVEVGERQPHLRRVVLVLLVGAAASGAWATPIQGMSHTPGFNLSCAASRLLGGFRMLGPWSPVDAGGLRELIGAVRSGLAAENRLVWSAVAQVLVRDWFRWPAPTERGFQWTREALDEVWRDCAEVWASLIRGPELELQQAAVRVLHRRGLSVRRDGDGHDMVRRWLVDIVVPALFEVLDGDPEGVERLIVGALLGALLDHAPDAEDVVDWLERTALPVDLEAVAWTLGLRVGPPHLETVVQAYQADAGARASEVYRGTDTWDPDARGVAATSLAKMLVERGVDVDRWLEALDAAQRAVLGAGMDYGSHTEVVEAWCTADASPFVSLATERWGRLAPPLRGVVLSALAGARPAVIQSVFRGEGPQAGFALGLARFLANPGSVPAEQARAWVDVVRRSHWGQRSVAVLHRLAASVGLSEKRTLLDWWEHGWRRVRDGAPNAPDARELHAVLRAILSPPVDEAVLLYFDRLARWSGEGSAPPEWDDAVLRAVLHVYGLKRSSPSWLVPGSALGAKVIAMLLRRDPSAFWSVCWRVFVEPGEGFEAVVNETNLATFMQLVRSSPRTSHGLYGINSTARSIPPGVMRGTSVVPGENVCTALLWAMGVEACRVLISNMDVDDPDRHDLLALAPYGVELVPLFVASLRGVVADDIGRARVFAWMFWRTDAPPSVRIQVALAPEHPVPPQRPSALRAALAPFLGDPRESPTLRRVLEELLAVDKYRDRQLDDLPPHVLRWVSEVQAHLRTCYAPNEPEREHD